MKSRRYTYAKVNNVRQSTRLWQVRHTEAGFSEEIQKLMAICENRFDRKQSRSITVHFAGGAY